MTSTFDRKLLAAALRGALLKFDPREQIKNPVMLVVLLGAFWSSAELIRNFTPFNLQIVVWLWFTVLFANFAEAIAEGRGKAQAESLRRTRTQTHARRLENGVETTIPAMATSFPPTATSSKASPAWTKPPSPANPRPSSAKAAATIAR
jgi:potassium-transporting ATPase ATP-binding subunit